MEISKPILRPKLSGEKKRSFSKKLSCPEQNHAINLHTAPTSCVQESPKGKRKSFKKSSRDGVDDYDINNTTVLTPKLYKEMKKLSFKNQRKKSRSGSFCDRLHHYTTIFFETGTIKYREYVEQYYHLEESWNNVITENVYMTRKLKMQQQAIWEFLTTERNYIRKLRVVVEVFQQCFKIVQSEGDLVDIKQGDIFGSINEVLLANDELWTVHLIKVINKARSNKQPIIPSQLFASFHQLEELFKPYMTFCLQQDACLKYLRDLTENSEPKRNNLTKDFKKYLTWCEGLHHCERFKLTDLMTEPMQRLTRYPLLLKKIKKETKDEEEIKLLDHLLKRFESFISNINRTLRKRYEQEKLDRCLEQFEYFSSMEAANEQVKWTAIDFLRMNVPNIRAEEQRCVLKQGSLKLIEKKTRHERNVEAFLFTDVFILTKVKKNTNKLRIIKQMFYLDKIKLIKSDITQNSFIFVYLDEFGLLATTMMIEVENNMDRDVWIGAVERAKQRYLNAKIGYGSTLDFFQDANIAMNDSDLEQAAKNQQLNETIHSTQLNMVGKSNYSQTSNESEQFQISKTQLPPQLPDNKTATWVLKNQDQQSMRVPEISNHKLHTGHSFRSNRSDSAIRQPSCDSGVSLRTCNSVPEIASPGNINELLTRRTDTAETIDSFDNVSTSSESTINCVNDENLKLQSSKKPQIDFNNNSQAGSKIRHLIYGKFFNEFDSGDKFSTLKPNMRYFKSVQTQTEGKRKSFLAYETKEEKYEDIKAVRQTRTKSHFYTKEDHVYDHLILHKNDKYPIYENIDRNFSSQNKITTNCENKSHDLSTQVTKALSERSISICMNNDMRSTEVAPSTNGQLKTSVEYSDDVFEVSMQNTYYEEDYLDSS